MPEEEEGEKERADFVFGDEKEKGPKKENKQLTLIINGIIVFIIMGAVILLLILLVAFFTIYILPLFA